MGLLLFWQDTGGAPPAITGTIAAAFPVTTAAGVLKETFDADGAVAFPVSTADADGSLSFDAAVAAGFPVTSADASGSQEFIAAIAATFPVTAADAEGSLEFIGEVAAAFPATTAAIEGTVEELPVSGVIAMTLPVTTAAIVGETEVFEEPGGGGAAALGYYYRPVEPLEEKPLAIVARIAVTLPVVSARITAKQRMKGWVYAKAGGPSASMDARLAFSMSGDSNVCRTVFSVDAKQRMTGIVTMDISGDARRQSMLRDDDEVLMALCGARGKQ